MLTQNLIKETLKLAGFRNSDVLSEILNYVPNPTVALEMLLSVHTPKLVDKETRFRKCRYVSKSDTEIVELLSYVELSNLVSYKKYIQNEKNVWYITQEDYKEGIFTDVKPEKSSYTSGRKPSSGYTTVVVSDTLENFISNYSIEITTMDANNICYDWNTYGISEEQKYALAFDDEIAV